MSPDDDRYFVMIFLPSGPKPMVSEDDTVDPPLALYPTAHDARETAKGNRACMAYGFEIFRFGNNDYE